LRRRAQIHPAAPFSGDFPKISRGQNAGFPVCPQKLPPSRSLKIASKRRQTMHTTTMKHRPTLAGAVWRAAKRILNPPAPTMSQRRVMRHLASMDEYLLADIGIGPSDIPYVVIEGRRPSVRARA
jgi:uncharacterized protein YjiS (DUF1127 family)